MSLPATRARTTVATATSLEVGVLDRTESVLRHAVAADGAVVFLPPAGSPLAAASLVPGSPAVSAVMLDVGPVPAADRLRGRVVMTGRPRPVSRRLPAPLVGFLCGEERAPGRQLLELSPQTIHLEWHVEGDLAQTVDPQEYAAARPDPLAGWEEGFLRHLADDHGDLLAPLAARLGHDVAPDERVRPVLADTDGVVLRVVDRSGCARDVRLGFDSPASCGCDVVAAFNGWLARTRPAGLDQCG